MTEKTMKFTDESGNKVEYAILEQKLINKTADYLINFSAFFPVKFLIITFLFIKFRIFILLL